jgi:plastocyanin
LRIQEYGAPPKVTLGAVAVVALIVPILLGYFLVTATATSKGYTSDFGVTSTTATAVVGPGVPVSIPSGSNNQANAPGYTPNTITVILGVNSTVTWTNNDAAAHTVTAVNMTAGAPIFDSGSMAPGAIFTYNFTAPGTYLYHCNFHAWMSGTVVVKTGTPSVKVLIPAGSNLPAGAPGYTPASIKLVIGVNNTVTWTNADTALHSVTSASVPTGASSFDSGPIAAGASYTYTFTVPGVYQYHCDFHPAWMMGNVTVIQG